MILVSPPSSNGWNVPLRIGQEGSSLEFACPGGGGGGVIENFNIIKPTAKREKKWYRVKKKKFS